MVDAMGGMQSPHFQRFKKLCFTAFSNLRKSASLIINLISLMVDASIPDIKVEPDKAVMKVALTQRCKIPELILMCLTGAGQVSTRFNRRRSHQAP